MAILFRKPEDVRWTHDGTTLVFRDIGETEWAAFVRQQNVVTPEILEKARMLADSEDSVYAMVYSCMTPEQREEWDGVDDRFFVRNWLGAEGMDKGGLQYEQMEDAHKMDFFRALQGIEEFRMFWVGYYRGKKKVSVLSEQQGESLDGAKPDAIRAGARKKKTT
jgi:hypothetical protein